ncbi:hypothetical protein K4K95_09100 [Phaeobacter inhibens]|uniref:hypothetical protein n=1 Tax=Phaeobacter inhibens TaxID=221822 RepID=UPI0021A5DD3B|nr:hypothetical protein [Phaeobacter inhibens]UWR66930.1 hypothetical protein K4K95_09100 [Phaeobacter inhibens]
MRETIITIANFAGLLGTWVMFTAWTVEAAAKGNAITAALFSPLAVAAAIVFAVTLAEKLGWLPLSK